MLRVAIPAFFVCFGLGVKAQITNNGFETLTTTSTDTVPAHWFMGDFGSVVSTNAHSGAYAMSVWNWYYYAPGYAVNGEADLFGAPFSGTPYLYGGEPISFKPTGLAGFYLYDTTTNGGDLDSAMIQIVLSRYNSTSGEREAVGFGEKRLPVAANYTAFSIPVNYTSALMPDTVVVAVLSSMNGMCNVSSSGTCLYLTVDDLALETTSGLVDFNRKNETAKVYPNPAQDKLTIDVAYASEKISQCVMTDIGGNVILQQEMLQNKTTIPVAELAPGLYFYQLKDQAGNVHYTGKAQVIR